MSAVPLSDRLLATAMRPQDSGTVTPNTTRADGQLSRYDNALDGGPGSPVPDTGISSLATAFGESGYSLQNYPSTDPGTIDDTIFAYARDDIDNFTDTIEDELTDTLRTAFENMLSNALESAGVNGAIANAEGQLEDATVGQLGDLADAAADSPFGTALAEATQIAEDLTEEFNELRDEVLHQFPHMVEEVETEIADEVAAVQGRIAERRESLNALGINEDRRDMIQHEIRALYREIGEITETYEDRLIIGLMEVVNEASDLYEMQIAEATYLVREWLRDTSNDIEVPWALGDDG